MLKQKMKNYVTQPKKVRILKEYRIVDPGLIAICIIFLQNLISVDKPNQYQIVSLTAFSIAIPMLAIHFLVLQILPTKEMTLPAYLAKGLEYLLTIGMAGTAFGIIFTLANYFWIVQFAFVLSFFFGMTILFFIKTHIDKPNGLATANQEEIQKPQ